MKLMFRSVQALTAATIFGYWGARFFTNPGHVHASMLVMGLVAVALSELGFRAGKKEQLEDVKRV